MAEKPIFVGVREWAPERAYVAGALRARGIIFRVIGEVLGVGSERAKQLLEPWHWKGLVNEYFIRRAEKISARETQIAELLSITRVR